MNWCRAVRANTKRGVTRGPFSELLQVRRHRIVLVSLARLALTLSPIVLTDASPAALLARAPLPLVLADARPAALLAPMPFAVVRAPRPTLLDCTTLSLSWLLPPAAPLFRFSTRCRPLTVHVCVPCRPVVARHAIGALERPSGSQFQQMSSPIPARNGAAVSPTCAIPMPPGGPSPTNWPKLTSLDSLRASRL